MLPALAMLSCGNSDIPEPERTERDPMAYMQLSVVTAELPDVSRAGDYEFEAPANKYECIHTMRFIIVDKDGNVEHNVSVAEENVTKTQKRLFKVKPNETKTVYLIGNEETVLDNDFIAKCVALKSGEAFPSEWKGVTLSRKTGEPLFNDEQYIPMTEFHNVVIGDPQEDASGQPVPYESTLFVTRASVKVTFNLTVDENYIGIKPDMLSSVAINEIADMEYLFPNGTIYDPLKVPASDADRIIKAYNTPATAKTAPYSLKWTQTGSTEREFTTGTVYLPETQYGNSVDIKKYSVTLHVNGADITADLPNLPSLPRNTHVVVNIALSGNSADFTVTVLPYTAVVLNPDFGIGDRPGFQPV